jgi:hypothetical protein
VNDFFRTRMGHTFFEVTLPRLVEELARLNGLLERALTIAELAVGQAKTQKNERTAP